MKKNSGLGFALIFFCANAAIPAFSLSSYLAQNMSLEAAVKVIFSAALIWIILSVPIGVVSQAKSWSTMDLISSVFGTNLQPYFSVIFTVLLSGWYAVNVHLLVEMIRHNSFQNFSGLHIFALSMLMSVTAIFGYRAMAKLSLIVAPILFLLIIRSLLQLNPISDFTDFHKLKFSSALSLVSGALILGTAFTADLARNIDSRRGVMSGLIFGYLFAAPFWLIVGILIAQGNDQKDFFQGFVAQGLGWIMVFFMILSTWSMNDNNLYSASIAFEKGTKLFSRRTAALVLALIVSVLSAWLPVLSFTNWLVALVPRPPEV